MRYFSSLSDLSTSRWGHGCGTIYAQDGSGNKEVVAAGDLRGQDYSVEIYSIADDSWRPGKIYFKEPNFPRALIMTIMTFFQLMICRRTSTTQRASHLETPSFL